MDSDLKTEATRIADDIVALVERTGGPVTLCRVHREVAGFAAAEPPYREICREKAGQRVIYWSGMTEAGAQALNDVLYGSRVAVEIVNVLPYFLDGGGLENDDWVPIVLLPASHANLSAKNGLFRVPKELLPSWKVLTPAGGSARPTDPRGGDYHVLVRQTG